MVNTNPINWTDRILKYKYLHPALIPFNLLHGFKHLTNLSPTFLRKFCYMNKYLVRHF